MIETERRRAELRAEPGRQPGRYCQCVYGAEALHTFTPDGRNDDGSASRPLPFAFMGYVGKFGNAC